MEPNENAIPAQGADNQLPPPETAAPAPSAPGTGPAPVPSAAEPVPAVLTQGWRQQPYQAPYQLAPQQGWTPYPPPPPGFFHRLFHDEGGTVCRALRAFAVVFFVLGCVTLLFGVVAGVSFRAPADISILILLGCVVAAAMQLATGLVLIALGKIIAMRWKK